MKTRRTAKWHKKLLLKEIRHLQEWGATTLKEAKKCFAYQKELREKYPKAEPCWECRIIAKKLNEPI